MRIVFLFCLLLLAIGCGGGPDLAVSDARVREPVPGIEKSVGYLVLTNRSDKARRLTSVSMEGVGAIEIHETAEVDGVMRMRRLSELVIPAGGSVSLEPGGKHLMLFRIGDLSAPVSASLYFADGEQVSASFDLVSFRATE